MVSMVSYMSFAVFHGAPVKEPCLNAVADHIFRPLAIAEADD